MILTVSALFKTSNQVQAQGNFSAVSSALGVARAIVTGIEDNAPTPRGTM